MLAGGEAASLTGFGGITSGFIAIGVELLLRGKLGEVKTFIDPIPGIVTAPGGSLIFDVVVLGGLFIGEGEVGLLDGEGEGEIGLLDGEGEMGLLDGEGEVGLSFMLTVEEFVVFEGKLFTEAEEVFVLLLFPS